jgi:hypothetical protein
VKRSGFGPARLFSTPFNSPNYYTALEFDSDNSLRFVDWNGSSNNFRLDTHALYRDPSGWMHVVVVFDSNNPIVSERMVIYVNGLRPSLATANYPSSV